MFFGATQKMICTNDSSRFSQSWHCLPGSSVQKTVCILPLSVVCVCVGGGGGRGGLNLLPNFQKGGGLAGSQFLEGVAGKEGSPFSGEGAFRFYRKKKLKTEIFNNKKSL